MEIDTKMTDRDLEALGHSVAPSFNEEEYIQVSPFQFIKKDSKLKETDKRGTFYSGNMTIVVPPESAIAEKLRTLCPPNYQPKTTPIACQIFAHQAGMSDIKAKTTSYAIINAASHFVAVMDCVLNPYEQISTEPTCRQERRHGSRTEQIAKAFKNGIVAAILHMGLYGLLLFDSFEEPCVFQHQVDEIQVTDPEFPPPDISPTVVLLIVAFILAPRAPQFCPKVA